MFDIGKKDIEHKDSTGHCLKAESNSYTNKQTVMLLPTKEVIQFVKYIFYKLSSL